MIKTSELQRIIHWVKLRYEGSSTMRGDMKVRNTIVFAVLVALAAIMLVGGIAVAQEPSLIIGLLLPGPKNDAGYNQTFYDAVLEVQENIPGVEVIVVEYVTDADAESTM